MAYGSGKSSDYRHCRKCKAQGRLLPLGAKHGRNWYRCSGCGELSAEHPNFPGSSEPLPSDRSPFEEMVEREVLREKKKGPKFDTLKKNAVKLTDEERKEVMDRGAVWHHGPNGEETPAVRKAVVDGKTWYWCATHRAGQVKPTLKGAINAYTFIKTTASLQRGPSIGG